MKSWTNCETTQRSPSIKDKKSKKRRNFKKRIKMASRTISILLFVLKIQTNFASIGDQSTVQKHCVNNCLLKNCTSNSLEEFLERQPLGEKVFQWSCHDECKYVCMWQTVNFFTQKHKRPCPQFNGKWPFKRILGVQEPASALFSVLNLIPHVYYGRLLYNTIPSGSPMKTVWLVYSLVSINTWTWSTVFHSKDSDFTEKMDYFCAFSVVAYSLLAFLIRLLGPGKNVLRDIKCTLSVAFIGALYTNHIYTMTFVKFDYGFNMALNIGVGAVNSICWIAWSVWHRKRLNHALKFCVPSVLYLNVTILLEVLDFPPIWWILDSHALWHLSTAPIHWLWYRFVLADIEYLAVEKAKKSKS